MLESLSQLFMCAFDMLNTPIVIDGVLTFTPLHGCVFSTAFVALFSFIAYMAG